MTLAILKKSGNEEEMFVDRNCALIGFPSFFGLFSSGFSKSFTGRFSGTFSLHFTSNSRFTEEISTTFLNTFGKHIIGFFANCSNVISFQLIKKLSWIPVGCQLCESLLSLCDLFCKQKCLLFFLTYGLNDSEVLKVNTQMFNFTDFLKFLKQNEDEYLSKKIQTSANLYFHSNLHTLTHNARSKLRQKTSKTIKQ